MSLTTENTSGNQKDRMMNGSMCRGNTQPALHRTCLTNSFAAKKVYLPRMAGALKGEHLPGIAEIRSDIRSPIPGGIVPGGDT